MYKFQVNNPKLLCTVSHVFLSALCLSEIAKILCHLLMLANAEFIKRIFKKVCNLF